MRTGLFALAAVALAFWGGTASAQQVIVTPGAPVVVPAYPAYPAYYAPYSGVTVGGVLRTRGGFAIGGTYSTAPVVPAYGAVAPVALPGPTVIPGPTVVASPVVVQPAPVVSVGVGVVPVYRPAYYGPYYGRPYYHHHRR